MSRAFIPPPPADDEDIARSPIKPNVSQPKPSFKFPSAPALVPFGQSSSSPSKAFFSGFNPSNDNRRTERPKRQPRTFQRPRTNPAKRQPRLGSRPRKDNTEQLEQIRTLAQQRDIPVEKCAESITLLRQILQQLRFERANAADKLRRSEDSINVEIDSLSAKIELLRKKLTDLPERKDLTRIDSEITEHQGVQNTFVEHKKTFEERFLIGKIQWTPSDLKFWLRENFPAMWTKHQDRIGSWSPQGKLAAVHISDVLLQTIGIDESSDREHILEFINTKREKYKADNPEEACVVCLVEQRSHVLVPCGHRCICMGCSRRVATCPVCRRNVESSIKIFL